MYGAARYIPPAKPKSSPKPAPTPSPTTNEDFPQGIGFSTERPYARYIPPRKGKPVARLQPHQIEAPEPEEPPKSKRKPAKVVFGDEDFPTPEPKKRKREEWYDEEETSKETKLDKTFGTKKRRAELGAPEPEEDVRKPGKEVHEPVAPIEPVEREAEDTPKKQKKEQKDKRERKDKKKMGKEARKEFLEAETEREDAISHEQVEPAADEPAATVVPDQPSEVVEDAEPPPKPKREKKKKREKEPDDVADEGADEMTEADKKHKSVLEKRDKALKVASKKAGAVKSEEVAPVTGEEMDWEGPEPVTAHGLEPIPQPKPVVQSDIKINYGTLPPWLASPLKVSSETRAPFTDLGISTDSAKILGEKGFPDAFAVQTAVIPLLMPTADRRGDVVVSAATGSGKTLAYVLPMVRDISQSNIRRLRGLIVLPTRDLVQQVKAACEACAEVFSDGTCKKIKIETAMGNRPFKQEQLEVMGEELKYDPKGYRELCKKKETLFNVDDSDEEEDLHHIGQVKRTRPDHVVSYSSKVDILICTPGRLVEHINLTPGFTLDYVRWLVVDEADKLTGQDYQQWLDIVLKKLATKRPGARDFAGCNHGGVRKVVLSATMTRDLSILNSLKLRRPTMVVLGEELRLPDTLEESAIRVTDSYYKALYLVDLLHSKYMGSLNQETTPADTKDADSDSSSDESSSESDSDSDSDSSSSSSPAPKSKTPSTKPSTAQKLLTTVLIFTQSNESALRLSRLLSILSPSLASQIGTLTSSTATARRARTLADFARGRVRVLVASDLVARGIDLERLEHVVNYDVPISPTAYIHRVGRTARANRRGHAWTLVEYAHARRFWREFVGKGEGAVCDIVRADGRTVERVKLYSSAAGEDEFSEERKEAYKKALEQLETEAAERRK